MNHLKWWCPKLWELLPIMQCAVTGFPILHIMFVTLKLRFLNRYCAGIFFYFVDHLKAETELAEEKRILNEMLEVVEQRDSLVALLEEQRLREKEEDKDLEAVMLSKGSSLNWA